MDALHFLGFATLIYAVQAAGYADLIADLQYLYNLDQLQNTIPLADFYPDEPYSDKMAADWNVAYPDTLSDPKEPRDYGEAALRDQEYMKQLPISGYQFISGGTGRQEDPSEVKTDKVLPAYCTPPNPCPTGYSGKDDCLKDFENTPENNRRILEEQDCPCDAEHMLSCPPGKKTIDPKSGFVSDGSDSDVTDLGSLDSISSLDELNLSENPYLSIDTKREKLVAKKSPHFIKKRDNSERFEDMYPWMVQESIDDMINPYLDGQPKSVAAKKQAPGYLIK